MVHIRGGTNSGSGLCPQAVAQASEKQLRYVVIDLSPVSHIDASAVRMLADLEADYAARGLQLVLSNPSTRVFRTMERAHLPELIGGGCPVCLLTAQCLICNNNVPVVQQQKVITPPEASQAAACCRLASTSGRC